MTEKYNIESFLITCDSDSGYTFYTYNNDEYIVTLEAIGERTVEPIPADDSGIIFNYYSRPLASLGTFYQSFYIEATSGEIVGDNHKVQLEGLDTYVKTINVDETFITYKDKIVDGNVSVNNGIVYVEWPTDIIDTESEEKINVQLSYISCVSLVLEQNYIVEISGETINDYHGVWECKEQEGILYLGEYDPFMESEEGPEEPEPAIALELQPVEDKNNLFYTDINYFIDYVEDSTTRYSINISGNILGEISDVKSSNGVIINNINYFYVGNLFLFTENQSDNTEEDYLFLSSGAGTETSESKLYVYTSEAETIEVLIDFETLTEIKELEGAALLSFGRDTPDEHNSLNNYGIAINSSDDFLALPQRAISLFETQIHPNESIKVGYKFRGILGTLPGLPTSDVSSIYSTHMKGTQGIYTDNMYLGGQQQYLAFYTDKNTHQKKLRITGADIYLTYNDEQSDNTLIDVIDGIEVGDGLFLTITSSAGTEFNTSNIEATLTAHLYKDGEEVLPEGTQTAEEVVNNLGYQVNWYNYTTTETLIKSNSMTLIVGPGANDDISAIDSIEIIAKLEDISNNQGE